MTYVFETVYWKLAENQKSQANPHAFEQYINGANKKRFDEVWCANSVRIYIVLFTWNIPRWKSIHNIHSPALFLTTVYPVYLYYISLYCILCVSRRKWIFSLSICGGGESYFFFRTIPLVSYILFFLYKNTIGRPNILWDSSGGISSSNRGWRKFWPVQMDNLKKTFKK